MQGVSWFDWEEWRHSRVAFVVGFVPAILYFLAKMRFIPTSTSYWSSVLEEATLGALAILVVVYLSYEIVKETTKFTRLSEEREIFGTFLGIGVCLAPVLWAIWAFFSWVGMIAPGEGTNVVTPLLWVLFALTLGVSHGREKEPGKIAVAVLAFGLGAESILTTIISLSNPMHGLYLKMVFSTIAALGYAVTITINTNLVALKRN